MSTGTPFHAHGASVRCRLLAGWSRCRNVTVKIYAALKNIINTLKRNTIYQTSRTASHCFVITLYNCCAATVNANIKNDRMLNVINYAWGGRPLNYVNSKFIAGANPWGNEDLRYFPVKQFRKDVAKIRKDYDFYQSIKDLQYEFIDDYEVLPNGGLKTVYSNGVVMLSNPTENEITAEGHTLIPFSNAVFR